MKTHSRVHNQYFFFFFAVREAKNCNYLQVEILYFNTFVIKLPT